MRPVTSTALCGSDLHHYDGVMTGGILVIEFKGRVVETGRDSTLQKGERCVVPFTIFRGACFHGMKPQVSDCDKANPAEKQDLTVPLYGQAMSGLFGSSHLTGGYPGGQAEYVRAPFSDVGPIVVPDHLEGEAVLFFSDILPTGWMAANCEVTPGDTVTVWGCGPVGLFAVQSALLMGDAQAIAIDHSPHRLKLARKLGAKVIDYRQTHLLKARREMTGGVSPDRIASSRSWRSCRSARP